LCLDKAILTKRQLLGRSFDECFVEYRTTILQPVRVSMCNHIVQRSSAIFTCSGWSAISPGEKHIVVSNLFDGLDFYSIANCTLSHSVPCPINQQSNALVPVLYSSDGSAVIVGGTSGSVRVLDSRSCETLQVLSHDGQLSGSFLFVLCG
jgi:WD40 repeat protein